MSDANFANMYIEKVVNEVLELTKVRMMNETRIAYLELEIAELQTQLEALKTKKNINKSKVNTLLEDTQAI